MKNLKELRIEKKIKQSELAAILGTSQQAISKYENGSAQPDIETQIAIADFFGCSIDYLFGRTDIKKLPSGVDIRDALKIRKTLEDLEFIKPGQELSNEQLSYLKKILDINAPLIRNIDVIKEKENNKKK